MDNDKDKIMDNGLTALEEVEVYDIYEEIEEDSSPFLESEEDLYLLDDEI